MVTMLAAYEQWLDSMIQTILMLCIEKNTVTICDDKFCASLQFHLSGKIRDFFLPGKW